MIGELAKIRTKDGVELQGFFAEPKQKRTDIAVLHVHGLAGNFYWNRFLDYIDNELSSRAISFLSVNTRGHDSYADFYLYKNSSIEIVEIGAAYELLKDSINDIDAWIHFLIKRGYKKIVLEGHSTGAVKAVYYLSNKYRNPISGLILISPSDDIGIQKERLGGRFKKAIIIAENFINNNDKDALMPEWCSDIPISAKTYVDIYGDKGKHGVFKFHDPKAKYNELSKIRCPIFIIFGTEEDAVVNNRVAEAINIIKENAKSSISVEHSIIQGAPHSYVGYEKKLASEIAKWLNKTYGSIKYKTARHISQGIMHNTAVK